MSDVKNAIIRNRMKLKSSASNPSTSKTSASNPSISKTSASKTSASKTEKKNKKTDNKNKSLDKNKTTNKSKKENKSLELKEDENINGMEDYRQFYLNFEKQKITSSNVMTKYEKAAVLGKRAQQIACGAIPLIKVTPTLHTAVDIAEEELRQKKNPYIIERDLGNGKTEHIKVREMVIY
tara:strand:- start:31 stop:570 length:540 start_codon:yes stop_codon:yes gene_type:complete